MDIKDELENELAMAILIENRLNIKLDSESGLHLIGKIKGALDMKPTLATEDPNLSTVTETAFAS
jgi:hypothetical protein